MKTAFIIIKKLKLETAFVIIKMLNLNTDFIIIKMLIARRPKSLPYLELWCLVVIVMFAKAQRELKASPLNPKLETPSKSEYSLSFEVWCFKAVKY